MTEAKTIKLLLSNGSLSGLLMAELLKWDGILFSSPRASYQSLSNEPESKYWGVYLLVSDDQVYIGQANELLRRISEHDKSKAWWERVVLLTTKDNSLNRSDIDYLENVLISIARAKGTLETTNIQSGNAAKVSRYRETELKDFLDGGLLLLELIGIKVFTKDVTDKKVKNPIPTHSKIEEDKLSLIIDSTINPHSDSNVLTKSHFIKMLRLKHGYDLSDGNITYASLNDKTKVFWANPQTSLLESRWYLILNDQFNRKLTLLSVPANSFSVLGTDTKRKLSVRKDKPYRIDLNLRASDLVDFRSKHDFLPYVIETIKY